MLPCTIKIVDDKSKYDKIKKVEPNIKFNRPDIRFKKDFGLLEIDYENNKKYISYHIDGHSCYLGLYMVEIPQYVFDEILKFLHKNQRVYQFHIVQSVNYAKGFKERMHWLLKLPKTWEEYDNQFSAKTKYNRRRSVKKLNETFNCKFEYIQEKDINEKLIARFFELKRSQMGSNAYSDMNNPKEYINDFNKLTDAYVLYINEEIASIVLYSIIDKHVAYCHNMTYDMSYSKYNIGNTLYYYSIKDLINRGIRKIYLGGGDYDYKRNSKATKTKTYLGNIFILSWWQKIFFCFIEKAPAKRITILIFGIKITFKL